MSTKISQNIDSSRSRISAQRNEDDFDTVTAMLPVVDHMLVRPVSHAGVSTFLPNCWTMFTILHSMHLYTGENADLLRVCPQYCTVAVRLYYGVLWFIQVLRAKHTAGIITNSESELLLCFLSRYPLQSLPIAGPLVPYFKGLGAVQPHDPMYSWVCPTLPTELGPGRANYSLKVEKSLMFPSVPGMVELLRSIAACPNFADSTNDCGEFVPFDLFAGGVFAAREFEQYGDVEEFPNDWTEVLDLPGINIAPEQSPDTLARIQANISRDISIPWIEEMTSFATLREFLLMTDDMTWFSKLVNIAAEEAKFFKGAATMDIIPSTSGLQTLVIGTTPPPELPSRRPTDWYPGFRVSDAKFQTTRGATSEKEFRLGIINQIIRTVPANVQGHGPLGTKESGDLVGPYWENNVYQYETPLIGSAQPYIGHLVCKSFYLQRVGTLEDQDME